MALYKILYWQHIPSQIRAWDDFDEISIELSQRFVAMIDRTAQEQHLTQSDEYLAQWNWSDEQEREGSPAEVAEAVKMELEGSFGK